MEYLKFRTTTPACSENAPASCPNNVTPQDYQMLSKGTGMQADPDRHGPEGGIVIVMALGMIVLLLAGILWALWPSAQRSGYDPGCSILRYVASADDFSGPLPGYCASACTLYMLRGWVRPETSLVFHLPSVDHEYWRGLMASHYPPAIAAWFLSLSPKSPAMEMTGAEAVRLGAAAC